MMWLSLYSGEGTAKALARLHGCAGSSELLLFAYVMSSFITWAAKYINFTEHINKLNLTQSMSSKHVNALQYATLVYTLNFLNIRTPKKLVVITLKFELCGSAIE